MDNIASIKKEIKNDYDRVLDRLDVFENRINSKFDKIDDKLSNINDEIVLLKIKDASSIENFIKNHKKLLITVILILGGAGGFPGISAILEKLL